MCVSETVKEDSVLMPFVVFRKFIAPNSAMEEDLDSERQQILEGSFNHPMQIDPSRGRFPCCIVWSPLPVISWFIPFIGHIGICREDGVVLDFAGPNYVCVDNFAFGAPTRYLQISKEKVGGVVCFTLSFGQEENTAFFF